MSSSTNYGCFYCLKYSSASISEYELLIQATEKTVWCAAHLPNKVIKNDSKRFSTYRTTTSYYATLTLYRDQPLSTWELIAYPRLALSATKRTYRAPIRFNHQDQVCQRHGMMQKKGKL